MTPHAIEPEQRTAAKVAGFMYLLAMATSIFAYYTRSQLVVGGDAVQTARNIMASEQLFRLSIVIDLITASMDVLLLWALYVVLRPINKNVALLAAFWRVGECAILAVASLNDFTALRFLGGAEYLRAFDTQQLQALARLFFGAQRSGFSIGFLFLGLGSTVFSYLWLKSRYIPRSLAAWGIFSSLVFTIVTLAIMVFPRIATILSLSYMAPMFIYEVGLGLWLLIKGIQSPRVE